VEEGLLSESYVNGKWFETSWGTRKRGKNTKRDWVIGKRNRERTRARGKRESGRDSAQ